MKRIFCKIIEKIKIKKFCTRLLQRKKKKKKQQMKNNNNNKYLHLTLQHAER